MASAFTHAFVAVAAGRICAPGPRPARFWITAIALSILPDLDVIGFAFGVRYQDFLGHRGFSHSLVFAMIAGATVLPMFPDRSWKTWLFFSAVTASHGVLDAMTDGGLGIAFFSPFVLTRYFFPWTPIQVSPIGVSSFFSLWGLQVLFSEFVFVWAPVILIGALIRILRSRMAKSQAPEPTG